VKSTRAIIDRKSGRTKRFTLEEFCCVQRAASLVGAVFFWRQVEQEAAPDWRVRIRATKILEQLAQIAYDDCQGMPASPQEAECF
jgi:hypothetical protein